MEKLLLSKGLCVSPLRNGPSNSTGSKSLREVVHEVDGQKDFNDYILSFSTGAHSTADVQYERHPVHFQRLIILRLNLCSDPFYRPWRLLLLLLHLPLAPRLPLRLKPRRQQIR